MLCYRCHKSVSTQEMRHGLHQSCFNKWFNTNSNVFQDVVSHSANSNGPKIGSFSDTPSSFFQGKFKKYSAKLGEKSYILKVQEEDYPELPETEYLCNQIAEILKIEVPRYHLIMFENKIPAFLCENFMQQHKGDNLIHIYHFLNDKCHYNCETLYKIILEKTQKIVNVRRFVECTLFDSLIGNHDRHGRNLALIQSAKGYTLSPLYDNPSNLAIEIEAFLEAQLEPRGKIATSTTDEPTMTDYVIEWKKLKQEEHVINFYNKINIKKLIKKIEESFIQEKRKNALTRLISKRYKEYQNAITKR